MFQIIINEILVDLINTVEVVSFIDNVIVRMEKKEKHNKMVEEVIKRLVENNLYVEPEKYIEGERGRVLRSSDRFR